jgi:hypothetical protein
VHVQHSVHIKRPVQQVSAALLEGPAKWFPRLKGENVSSLGLHVAGVPVRKKVAVEFGDPVKTSTWAVVPVTWKATFPQSLFPVMTGKVDLAPVSKEETRLTVSGMYEPPLGRLGEELNEAVMHRVAEGTVKELAESIAKRLEKAAGR